MDRSVVIYDFNKIGAELCKRKLSTFVKEFWSVIIPNELIWNWHMDVLCDEIQASDERVFQRLEKLADLIVNIPPGTTKTQIVSVMSTAWEFARMPSIKVFVGSFSDSAVSGIADNIRLLMKSAKYQAFFPEVQIRHDRDSLHNFKTTENGEFYAFTVGGTITSKHADILKIDDPLNPKQAASEANLKTANDFFDNTLPTRKVDKLVTPFYLVMQRLSVKDPTAHLLKKMGKSINHICLPGKVSKFVKPEKYKALYEDGFLDKKRLSQKALDDLFLQMGSAAFAGQVGMTPTPEGGTIWQKGWFKIVPDNLFPATYLLSSPGTDWDLAYTKEEANSASAYIKSGMIDENIFIYDLDFKWLEFPELISWMKKTGGPHYIENKGPGKSSKQTLKKSGIIAVEVKVNRDKISRAKDATPPVEAGFVFLKESLADKLFDDTQQGILFFPKGEHNDVADALSQMISRRTNGGKVVTSGSDHEQQYNQGNEPGQSSELSNEDLLDYV